MLHDRSCCGSQHRSPCRSHSGCPIRKLHCYGPFHAPRACAGAHAPSPCDRLPVPDGREDLQHVGARHFRDRHLADAREGVAFQAAQPGLRVLAVAPGGPQLVPDLFGGIGKGCGIRPGAASPLGQGIAPPDGPACGWRRPCWRASLSETSGEPAQSEFGSGVPRMVSR